MTDGTWAVARTKTRAELVAQEQLKQQGFEQYLPMYMNSMTQKPSILFPGYIFVVVVDGWRAVRSTIGILDFIMEGDNPAQLRAHEMAQLKAREVSDGLLVLEPYKIGQNVLVKRGPAKDQIAVFDGMTARDRCRVLLGWLKTELPVRDLVAA